GGRRPPAPRSTPRDTWGPDAGRRRCHSGGRRSSSSSRRSRRRSCERRARRSRRAGDCPRDRRDQRREAASDPLPPRGGSPSAPPRRGAPPPFPRPPPSRRRGTRNPSAWARAPLEVLEELDEGPLVDIAEPRFLFEGVGAEVVSAVDHVVRTLAELEQPLAERGELLAGFLVGGLRR